ncbi:cytochrome P450 [Favolaschia claudopus]|uniref:Cytochrome P450 n=1 Tax=Favolaschia claudopus TaxID=2862362 RepID=A0AAV9ZDL2_9AGAR
MDLPPGIVYLARILPSTLLPSAVTYVFLTRILPLLDLGISPPAFPIGVAISYVLKEIHYARDAVLRGAVHIPTVPDKWPGGLSLIEAMKKSVYPADFLLDWTDLYGNTVVAKILGDRAIFTTEPEYIKIAQCRLITGVFNTDGEFHRTMSRPFFNRERISDFDLFDRHSNDALTRLNQRLSEGYAIDIQDLVSRFTLDSATEFLFGKSVDSISAGLPYPYSAIPSPPHPTSTKTTPFGHAQLLTTKRTAYSTNGRCKKFWKDKVKPMRKICDDYVGEILQSALERKRAGRRGSGEKEQETFLSHLVDATEDKEVIMDSIFNILVAGRDTTAATLTFAVYMLAEHRDMADRLRKEVLEVVGSSRMPTYDDVRTMKYLRAFINETLRLYPPVKRRFWPALKPGDKPLYVTPNSRVRYSVFLMHRRTDLWGPDALMFDPDRFLDERVRKYLTPNPFIFLPFNAGPRICLGQQFAYNEASFFIIRLLQKFTAFTLAPDAQPESTIPPASWKHAKGTQATEKIMLQRHLTMFAKGGLWVRMKLVVAE